MAETNKRKQTHQEFKVVKKNKRGNIIIIEINNISSIQRNIKQFEKQIIEQNKLLSSEYRKEVIKYMNAGNLDEANRIIKLSLYLNDSFSKFLEFRLMILSKRGIKDIIEYMGLNKDNKYIQIYIYGFFIRVLYMNHVMNNKVEQIFGCKCSLLTAIKYLELSANQNLYRAQYKLGNIYIEGELIPQDTKKGFEYIKKSAEQKYRKATEKLALCYTNGIGVERDITKGREYFELSLNLSNLDDDILSIIWIF